MNEAGRRCPVRYACRRRAAGVDTLPIHYDRKAWQESLLINWPEGSAAWQSCFRRITDGPDYAMDSTAGREASGMLR